LPVERRPFSSRLREDYADRLLELAAETGKPQTRLLEEALALYFQQLKKR
jgi:predicted transcriptional regulator